MKAILVIDQPKVCTECPLYSEDDYGFGCGYGTLEIRRQTNVNDEIPAWCPLKPMSKKLQFQEPFNDDYTVSWASRLGFVDGWNACLDSIIGENNESNTCD